MNRAMRWFVGQARGAANGGGAGGASRILSAPLALLLLAGCAQVPNQWVEDGPATTAEWDSPTAKDLHANYAPAELRRRDWDAALAVAGPGRVTHWPLYFEDPFVDKGHGRKGLNKYHIGWEDYVAMPYDYARFTLNWLMLPASAVATPPWTLMESDGRLSRQALGYDHDAAHADSHAPDPSQATQGEDKRKSEDEAPADTAHS